MTKKTKQAKNDRRLFLTGAISVAVAAGSAPLLAAVTPSQTEGPFFPIVDQADKDADLTRIMGHQESALGEVVMVEGRVLDESGEPIAGALIDVWQANVHGRYSHEADPNPQPLDPNFQGWGKLVTDEQGGYRFTTIIPGAYKVGEDWSRPPHIHFKVARRGFHELTTQMYFSGHPLNDLDRLLLAVPEPARETLVVNFDPQADGPPRGVFNLVLGEVEAV